MSLTLENAIATVTGGTVLDLAKITALVQEIVSAAPAIIDGIVSIEPYVEAIVAMIANGGNPTDAQWATLQASLAAGSATLQAAASEAQSEINAAPTAATGE